MTNKNMTISIPEEIVDKLERKRQETNFDSVSDYIIYILKQVISKTEIETKHEKEIAPTKEEEEQIKEKLKQLGYL